VFGWDRELLEGSTPESRAWREQTDPWWAERLGMPHLTPRWVLQYWGTEVCRKSFHDDIWIASLENKLRTSKDNVVISDCRFPNEIEAIKNAGGKIVWVQRGNLPEWYDSAIMANRGSNIGINEMKRLGIHASEWAWLGCSFDEVVDNNSSIDDLYKQAQTLVVGNKIALPPSDTVFA
jgi:hypothetical protein